MAITPETLVNKSTQLASPPETYQQLANMLHDPDSFINDISAVINTDPALAARLLKIVNSPFYGFPSQINTISRALTIIGTRDLIQLVLATTVVNRFQGIPDNLVNIRTFWKHSIACAIMARLLAKQVQQGTNERLFIAGLLHNIGSLVLFQSLPEIAKEALNQAEHGDELLYNAERRLLGFDHTHVGEALLRKWHFPESLKQVVRYHHSPAQAKKSYRLDVAIVHIADILVTSVPFGNSGDRQVPPLDPAAWELLNIDLKLIPDLLDSVSEQLDPLALAMLT